MGSCQSARTIKCGVPRADLAVGKYTIVYTIVSSAYILGIIPSMHADDTSITSGDSDVTMLENRINKDLSGLNDWLKANRLSLRVNTCMIIGSGQRINKLKDDLNRKC